MRYLFLPAAALVAAAALLAQPPAQPNKDFASAADVAAMIAKAKSDRAAKGNTQPLINQNILRDAPYAANLEYRASVGTAATHETEAEMFYVVDGSATMVTGGKLTGETRTNAENLSGTGIEGGTARTVSKGDFIMVPQKTPHWFSKIDGVLVLMSIHLPHK
jgi:mannose-6-phosphate isomerase-like protein (cupin superfamily)